MGTDKHEGRGHDKRLDGTPSRGVKSPQSHKGSARRGANCRLNGSRGLIGGGHGPQRSKIKRGEVPAHSDEGGKTDRTRQTDIQREYPVTARKVAGRHTGMSKVERNSGGQQELVGDGNQIGSSIWHETEVPFGQEATGTGTEFVEGVPDRMRTQRSLEALRIAHGLSDRQKGHHTCIPAGPEGRRCWCRVEDGQTRFPHSHGETGNVCSEARCEWHSQWSREEIEEGQIGSWN